MQISMLKKINILFFIVLLAVFTYLVLSNDNKTTTLDYTITPAKSNQLISNNRIVLRTEDFFQSYIEIMHNINKYQGIEIEVEGFIRREDQGRENQFIVSREIDICEDEHIHEEELEIVGLLSYWESSEEIADNTWIRIIGNLQSIQYYDELSGRNITSPIIIVESLEEIEEPENPYIHP